MADTAVNGLGINSVALSAPSFGLISSQLQNGITYAPGALNALNLSPGVNTTPGQLNAFSAVWGGLYNDPSAGRPARINQWNIALQRQVTKDTSIEAAYVGNRGVWEQSNSLVSLNAITPAILAALRYRSHERGDQNFADFADRVRGGEGGRLSRCLAPRSRQPPPSRRVCGRSPSTAPCRRSSSIRATAGMTRCR